MKFKEIERDRSKLYNSFKFLFYLCFNRPQDKAYDEVLERYMASIDDEIFEQYVLMQNTYSRNFDEGYYHFMKIQELIDSRINTCNRYRPLSLVFLMMRRVENKY